jgi:alpha 1,3-glucosidase
MVTIIDPHIKRDDTYRISKQAKELDFFVKNVTGVDFEGSCWPGTSNWIDYLNPYARRYWAEQYRLENYEASSLKCASLFQRLFVLTKHRVLLCRYIHGTI